MSDRDAAVALVSPSDIAELAGVTRAAVSNWRKRTENFPEPVAGSAGRPLFDRRDVVEWLGQQGIAVRDVSPDEEIWATLNAFRGLVHWDDLAQIVLSFACAVILIRDHEAELNWQTQLAGIRDDGPWDKLEALIAGLRSLDAEASELVALPASARHLPIARLIDLLMTINSVPSDQLPDVCDAVLARLSTAQVKAGAEYGFIGSPTSALLASLAAAHPGARLYDPACGVASALIEAVRRGVGPRELYGHEINLHALRIARQRSFLHDIDLVVEQADVLEDDPDPLLEADVIIAEPPFGLRWQAEHAVVDRRFVFGTPPKSSADMAWIQHVVHHLADDGRGYVITSAGPLHRGGVEGAIRSKLIQAGCVEAIVGLPPRMLPQTSIALSLWVLRSPKGNRGNSAVRLIDASTSPLDELNVAEWLAADPETEIEVPQASVPVASLLAEGAVLTPRRWTAEESRDAHEISQRLKDAALDAAALSSLVPALLGFTSEFARLREVHVTRILKMSELVSQGLVDIKLGRPFDKSPTTSDAILARIVRPTDLGGVTLPPMPEAVPVDDHPDLTRPGDVLVATTNTVRAVVDLEGGHIPGLHVYRVRVANPEVLRPAFLAEMLTGSWNERWQQVGTLHRPPIGVLEIPLMDPEDQQAVIAGATAVRTLQQTAAELSAASGTLHDALLDAFRYSAEIPDLTRGRGAEGTEID